MNRFLESSVNHLKINPKISSRSPTSIEVSNQLLSRGYKCSEIIALNGTNLIASRSQPYTGFSVDLWSAGIVLFVMVTGLMPYNDQNPQRMLSKQLQHRLTFPRRILISKEVKTLIYEILHPIPSQRKQYSDILTSTWLADTPYKFRTANNCDKDDLLELL